MSRVVLVRHADAVTPRVGGPSEYERPLSALGHQQASALVPDLVALGPDRVVSSPYLRAIQSVSPAAEALGVAVELDPDLREWDSGIAPTPDWEEQYRQSWRVEDECREGGESHRTLQIRASSALRRYLGGDDTVVVIASHGTWISRALRGLGLDIDADFWLAMPMPAVYLIDATGSEVGDLPQTTPHGGLGKLTHLPEGQASAGISSHH